MSREAASKARIKGNHLVKTVCALLFAMLLALLIVTRWLHVDRVARVALHDAPAQVAPEPSPRPSPKPLACAPMEHTELWGDVIVPGIGPGSTVARTPSECCALCARTRGCNAWVACSDPGACQTQCWLKWQRDPRQVVQHASSPSVPWTSGALLKDFDDGSNPYEPGSAERITLVTPLGQLVIRLHPDWSQGSTAYVRKVARHGLCTAKCIFYRAEPGFLLQGALAAIIAPNNETRTRGPQMAMERGDVAWAGGFAGPDFFITHVRVGGFGSSHTVWGSLDGPESFAVLDRLVLLPAHSATPGGMKMIDEPPAIELIRGVE